MAMPERIWLPAIDDAPALAVKTGPDEVEYVRADITYDLVDDTLTPAYMLGFERGKDAAATTHQRTLDALEQVLDDSRHGLTMAPATRALALYTYAQGGGTDPDILAGLDAATAMLTELGHFGSQAALARIKEAT